MALTHKINLCSKSSVLSRHVLVQQPGRKMLVTNIDAFLQASKASANVQQLAVHLCRKRLLYLLSTFYPAIADWPFMYF